MGFAERLKQKRREAGLTQRELAERCGLTAATIRNYENSARRPSSLCVVQMIAMNLHTSTEYLLSGNGVSDEALKRLTKDLTKLFLSGETSEVQLDNAMKALWRAYWKARGVE